MTLLDVLELPSGPELDAAVARARGWLVLEIEEKLYGIRTEPDELKASDGLLWRPLPAFSTDLAAAMELGMEVGAETRCFQTSVMITQAWATFELEWEQGAFASLEECGEDRSVAQATAICRAALLHAARKASPAAPTPPIGERPLRDEERSDYLTLAWELAHQHVPGLRVTGLREERRWILEARAPGDEATLRNQFRSFADDWRQRVPERHRNAIGLDLRSEADANETKTG